MTCMCTGRCKIPPYTCNGVTNTLAPLDSPPFTGNPTVTAVPDISNRPLAMEDAIIALKWFLSESETNRGDEPIARFQGSSWNDVNSYWIANEDLAQAIVDRWEADHRVSI